MDQLQVQCEPRADTLAETPAVIVKNGPTIASLFYELLVEIFHHSQSLCSLSHLHAWIRVTHVCRLWRDIALSTPTLWRTVRIGETIGVPTIHCERSKDVLLDVIFLCKLPMDNIVAAGNLLAQHSRSIQSLVLHKDNPGLCGVLDLFLFSIPAPALSPLQAQLNNPDVLRALPAPKLRSLVLDLFSPISWSQPRSLTGLSHLSVGIRHVDLTTFLASLDIVPQLEELCISIEFPHSVSRDTVLLHRRHRCSLPKLRLLSVLAAAEEVHLFLSSVEFSASTIVRLSLLSLKLGVMTWRDALCSVPDPRQLGSFTSSSCFNISALHHSPKGATNFAIWGQDEMPQHPTDVGRMGGFSLDTFRFSAPQDVVAFFTHIGGLLAAAPVTALRILLDAPVPLEAWHALLSRLPALQLLLYQHMNGGADIIPVLEGKGGRGTGTSIGSSDDPTPPSMTSELLCPNLRLVETSSPVSIPLSTSSAATAEGELSLGEWSRVLWFALTPSSKPRSPGTSVPQRRFITGKAFCTAMETNAGLPADMNGLMVAVDSSLLKLVRASQTFDVAPRSIWF